MNTKQTIQSLDRFVMEGVNVEVNIVPMSQNQDDLKITADFILDRGARKVNFLKLVRQGNAEKNWESIRPNYKKLGDALECLRSDELVRVGTPFGQLKSRGQYCGAGYKKICITYDGYILPCEVFKHDRKKFPNINDDRLLLTDVITSFSDLISISDHSNVSCYKKVIVKALFHLRGKHA